MDAFESLVCEILRWHGYWVHNAYKVELTPHDKRQIGKTSSPRWELDVVAYKGRTNEVIVMECKSYLDSAGVTYRGITDREHSTRKRYKLFNQEPIRRVVLTRLVSQMHDVGLVSEDPHVTLALAAGKIVERDRERLHHHFEERGWLLWDRDRLKRKLLEMTAGGYENSPVAVTLKLLLR